MTGNARNQIGAGRRISQTIVLLTVLFCLVLSAGCAATKLDPTAESIVITDLSQLRNQDFAGFDRLKTLDLRGVSVDAEMVDTLQAKLPCINCYRKICSHHSCMAMLTPARVLRHLRETAQEKA